MYYHLRVSVSESPDDANAVIEAFINTFPLTSYIFGYEVVEDNFHFHGHIQYDPSFDPTAAKNKVKRSEFFKKMKKLEYVPDKNESNYHEVCKDEMKNLAYVIKECHILRCHNIDEEIINQAKSTVDRIETEKNQKMKDQLLNAWLPRERLFVSRLEAFIFIDTYHVQRDYLPPNMTNKIQYALYIIYKIHEIEKYEFTENSYKLIGSFMNIYEKEATESASTINFMTISYDEKKLIQSNNNPPNDIMA